MTPERIAKFMVFVPPVLWVAALVFAWHGGNNWLWAYFLLGTAIWVEIGL